VLQAEEHAPTFSLSVVFTFGLVVESIKELEGASSSNFFSNYYWALNRAKWARNMVFTYQFN
jgi:hypothetical protein